MSFIVFIGCLLCNAWAEAPKTLKVWHAYRDAEAQVLEDILEQYDEQHSSISLEVLPVAYDAYASKLESAIPRNNGPDVFIYAHEKIGSWAEMGLIEPISLDTLTTANLSSVAVEAVQYNQTTYGAPMAVKSLVLYCNNDLVSKAPVNTDELFSLNETLPNGVSTLAYPATDAYFHMPWLFGFGGGFFDKEGNSTFESPANADSLDFMKSMDTAGLLPKEPDAALSTHLFNNGQAAMTISGPWFLSSIDSTIDFSIHPLPIISATGKPAQPLLTVESAFISRFSTQKQEASALVKHLIGLDSATKRALEAGQIVPNEQAWENPTLQEDPILLAFKAQMLNSIPTPNIPTMTAVWEPMARAVRRVHRGAMTGSQALEQAAIEFQIYTKPAPEPANPIPYVILAFAGLCAGILWGWRQLQHWKKDIWESRTAYLYVAPAAIAMTLLTALPFVVGALVSLFAHNQGAFTFVGLANFFDIIFARDWSVTSSLSFYFTLMVTIGWTLGNLFLHVGIGLALAMLLREPWLRFRGFYRVLLIVPWAIPNYITALIWKGMFHQQFGAINGLLQSLGLEPVSWFAQFSTSFAANLITNTWLGFPFMMVVSLGALQSIPRDLEDAASVDGAGGWQRFWHITLPLLKPALLPAVVLGSVWTFNMFNVIYLVSAGEPDSSTDILISDAYRWAFSRGNRYGYASAYAVLIFFILFGYSKLGNRIAGRKTI